MCSDWFEFGDVCFEYLYVVSGDCECLVYDFVFGYWGDVGVGVEYCW